MVRYRIKKASELYPEIKGKRCWEWVGTLDRRSGYGKFGRLLVHRVYWEYSNGRQIPKGMCVLHKCDNKKCVRHLLLGTHAMNAMDKCLKGRQAKGLKHSLSHSGERNSSAKLRDVDIPKIRKMAKRFSHSFIAKKFSVTRSCISRRLRLLSKDDYERKG